MYKIQFVAQVLFKYNRTFDLKVATRIIVMAMNMQTQRARIAYVTVAIEINLRKVDKGTDDCFI